MDAERKPYLSRTGIPCELVLDPTEAGLNDIKNLLSLCIASDRLWFRIEYSNVEGERCGISPVDFINARFDAKLKDDILEGKSRELLWGEGIVVTVLNPKQLEGRAR